ncbi:HEAT repeat domain-containing protein [Streptomyces sp. NPDC088354]|uniref:HEAT repeat domain-containing protein n=1 Tax=Streptomyces sp. NPDC088354 TaxID=3365856 RepID=UPI0037FCB647
MGETTAAALEALAVGLADPDGDVDALHVVEQRLVAARDTALVPALEAHLAAAVDAGNWYARVVLARLLVRTAGRTSLPALLRAYARDLGDDQDSLTTDLTVLVREDPASARALLLAWTGDRDPDLRRTAVWLLGYIPDPADIAWLARAATDADEKVRAAAAGTLAGHSGTDPRAADVLAGLLCDSSPQVRICVLDSLGYARRLQTLPAIRAAADDREARVRAWVAIALDRFPQPEAGPDPGTVTVLERLGEDPDAYVRETALAALQRLRAAGTD